MPLAGTFDVLDFAEVLGLLARRESTGRLHVRTESIQASIWLADGKSVVAEMTTGNAADTKAKGRRLLEDICFDALKSSRGSFEFQAQDEVERLSEERIELESVVEAARIRLEQWRDVESVIHSFDAVPRLAQLLPEEITVDPERWRIFVALDGRRNVASLARRLDMELLTFCALLKPLIEQGAVEIDHPKGRMRSLPKVRLDRPVAGEEVPVFGAEDLEDESVGVGPDDQEAGRGPATDEPDSSSDDQPVAEGAPVDGTGVPAKDESELAEAADEAESGAVQVGRDVQLVGTPGASSGSAEAPLDSAAAEAPGHRGSWGRRRRNRHLPDSAAGAPNGA